MPFVSGYFRRSPGAGGSEPPATRQPSVSIFGADGRLLHGTGGPWAVRALRFESGLPGGFLSASFQIAGEGARTFRGRAGLKVVIHRGRRVLWWGWLEDLQRSGRGQGEQIDVTCLGPWQQVRERLSSPNYAGTVTGDQAIMDQLRSFCPDISTNYSEIAATGSNIAPLAWSYKPVADVVEMVCAAGNVSGQALLFAIWEPSLRGIGQYPTTAVSNPAMELGSGSPTGWSYTALSGSAGTWDVSTSRSPIRSLGTLRSAGAGTQTGYWHQDYIPCLASTWYLADYAVKFGLEGGGLGGHVNLGWYTSELAFISNPSLPTRTGGAVSEFTRYVDRVQSPANAAFVTVGLYALLPDVANATINWDDVYLYRETDQGPVDGRPKARLWARDLSGWEYKLLTRELDDGLQADETTRELANWVVASYGSSLYSDVAQDGTSQVAYRRRDAVVEAGQVAEGVAEAMRAAHLARHAAPALEVRPIRLSAPGAVHRPRGGLAWPEDLRAGDRLLIEDGVAAGRIVLLTRVSYDNGVVTLTPERADDVPLMLARR